MQRRPSARILLLNQNSRILLFHFVYTRGPLAGKNYWAAPGGGVEKGESFVEAAKRELYEETGIIVDTVDLPIAKKEYCLQLPDGEYVIAEEQFFLVKTSNEVMLSPAQLTLLEKEVMKEHRWWSMDEIAMTKETVYPVDLIDILKNAGMGEG